MPNEITIAHSQPMHVFANSQTFETAQRIAGALSKSTLVPKEYQNNLPNALIALEIAQRTGASPLLVMQNLAVIHGKPSWSSQFIIASVNSCGRFHSLRFDVTGKPNEDTRTCVAWTVERHIEIPADVHTLAQAIERSLPVLDSPPVSIKMAKDEGWHGKNGSKWKTMPDLMLRYRAATFFGRLYAPEILMGMRTQDENDDIIDVTPVSQESTVLTNINEAIRAEEEAGKAVIEAASETAQQETAEVALTLDDWIEEIKSAPTLEGIEHKVQEARKAFLKDQNALAKIGLTRTEALRAVQAAKKAEGETIDKGE